MALGIGQKLGHYEITAPIGVGGMGEVYRARDTRLNRSVAIKVLPGAQNEDAEARRRFEREAQAISSLNHPNICTVHDFGEHNGARYMVMEYLEGQTLAQRLLKGPLPLADLLTCAAQIAAALDQAHRRGLIHRDLKPANIMLTKSGAKLLDFGLVREVSVPSMETTVTSALTAEGSVLGTYPYMSPEQVQGREIDARSDIFSFGATIYEAATGKQAFPGGNAASVIAAVLEHEPEPVSTLLPAAPTALNWVIRTCLRKDPGERWQSAFDLKLALERVPEVLPSRPMPRRAWALVAGATAFGILLTWSLTRFLSSAQEVKSHSPELMRFHVSPPPGLRFSDAYWASVPVIQMALSPDGSQLAFVAEGDDAPRLWIRRMNEPSAKPVPGTDGGSRPFWSPDSRSIGFFSQNSLKRVDAAGGPAIALAPASVDARGGAWLTSGAIVFAISNRDEMRQVSASGGEVRSAFPSGESNDRTRWWPFPLPGRDRFLFFSRTGKGLFVGRLNEGASPLNCETNWAAQHDGQGRILFLRNSVLFAQQMDESAGRLLGDPQPVAEGVGGSPTGTAGFSVSRNGVLAHGPALRDMTRLIWHDRQGNARESIGEPGMLTDLSVSPDGSQIAWSRVDPTAQSQDIWLHDAVRGTTSRLTSEPTVEASPTWSADSRRLLYRSNRRGLINFFVREIASGVDHAVFNREEQFQAHGGSSNGNPTAWSRDGKFAIYHVAGRSTYDLFALPMQEPRTPIPLARSESNEIHGSLSPDGRWLTYASDETGRFEVYRVAFPTGGSRQQVSSKGGANPIWRGDGREIYFISADQMLTAVGVGPNGELGRSQELFRAPIRPGVHPYRIEFSPSPDGQRFLLNVLEKNQAPPVITVIVNWPSLLGR